MTLTAGIPIVDLRQDSHYYYLRLGYTPGFYRLLAEFEAALNPDERRYDPQLHMWRIPKTAAARLPEFFPNFETLAAGEVPPARPIYTRLPWATLGNLAMYATVALIAVWLWRTVTPANVVQAAAGRLPESVSRLVITTPKQLAQAGLLDSSVPSRPLFRMSRPLTNRDISDALLRSQSVRDERVTRAIGPATSAVASVPSAQPAAAAAASVASASAGSLPPNCRLNQPPLGMVYVNAAQVDLRESPNAAAKVLGTNRKGEAICVYKIDGEWQGGTVEGLEGFVWVHQASLSLTPP